MTQNAAMNRYADGEDAAFSKQPVRLAVALCTFGAVLAFPFSCIGAPGKGALEDGALAAAQSADGARTVFDVRIEPRGLQCPTGGQLLLGGLDENLNGALDLSEVREKAYFCRGVSRDGEPSGFSSRNEAPGITCPTGGRMYSWGYDEDRNGQLDHGEALFNIYVCLPREKDWI